jgi:hypothetical protein
MGDRDVDWLDELAELKAVNAKMRDLLRWRKWPEEKPEAEQQCQLILANKLAPILCCSKYPFDHWENLNATHWRPIGPLPKEMSNERVLQENARRAALPSGQKVCTAD